MRFDIFTEDGDTEGITTLLVTNETFTALTGITNDAVLTVLLNSVATDEDIIQIKALVGDSLYFEDLRENNIAGSYAAFIFCACSFLLIIGLVAVLNIVNNISMGVTARMRQFSVMWAVGMEQKQLIHMIAAEEITYGAAGLFIGMGIGLPFSNMLFQVLVSTHFHYEHYHPTLSIILSVLFISMAVIIGVIAATKKLDSLS